jgi:hypothetical protein
MAEVDEEDGNKEEPDVIGPDLEDREDDSIDWDKAVERGQFLAGIVENSQWGLGKLADKVCIAYGEETLQRFSEAIGVHYETLKRYRSVWRAWSQYDGHPNKYAVGRALAKIPDKHLVYNALLQETGDGEEVTERAAIAAARDYRERRSEGKYADYPLHKVVSRACKIINAIMDEHCELTSLLTDVKCYQNVDYEYTHKIDDALDRAIQRLTEVREAFTK